MEISISAQRATVLMAIAHFLHSVALQLDRLLGFSPKFQVGRDLYQRDDFDQACVTAASDPSMSQLAIERDGLYTLMLHQCIAFLEKSKYNQLVISLFGRKSS
jgi:hypothetical protein